MEIIQYDNYSTKRIQHCGYSKDIIRFEEYRAEKIQHEGYST